MLLTDRQTDRQTGIELLRIVTMLMIIGLHYLLFGGPLFHAKGLNQKLAWFIEAFFFVAVNCYVLISGYFLVTKKNFHMKKNSIFMAAGYFLYDNLLLHASVFSALISLERFFSCGITCTV